jgi:REP element-mobilizing transposase RayT
VREVCAGVGAALREFNGETDHVQLWRTTPPSLALSVLATSCGGAPLTVIKQYIEHQNRPTKPARDASRQAGSASSRP